MARAFGDLAQFPTKAVNPDVVLGSVDITIGAAGAVSSVDGMPGVSAANSGAGTFNLVYPACPAVRIVYCIEKSTTVFQIVGTAKSATAGTAAFRTNAGGGVATDPASGDIITVVFYARSKGVV